MTLHRTTCPCLPAQHSTGQTGCDPHRAISIPQPRPPSLSTSPSCAPTSYLFLRYWMEHEASWSSLKLIPSTWDTEPPEVQYSTVQYILHGLNGRSLFITEREGAKGDKDNIVGQNSWQKDGDISIIFRSEISRLNRTRTQHHMYKQTSCKLRFYRK